MVELDDLLAVSIDKDLVFELLVKPGDHLLRGQAVARVWGTNNLDEALLKRVIHAFLIGGERTPTQDIRYLFRQLTDVVIRALSPGINDPFTAINGIDELATGVALLSQHARVSENRLDEKGVLRLVVPTTSVGEVLMETVGILPFTAPKTAMSWQACAEC